MPIAGQRETTAPSSSNSVMLRSIFHASFFTLLKPTTQIDRCRKLPLSNPCQNHHYRTLPIYHGGNMINVLEILGPFDHIFPTNESNPYVGLLRKCIRSKSFLMGSLVHSHLIKFGLDGDLMVSNVILNMYAKVGLLDSCLKLFDGMHDRDVISWCTLISGFVSHGFDFEAYGLLRRMMRSNVKANQFVVSSVLKGCSASGVLELGLMVHCLVVKSGMGFDRFVEIGLVDMYAKCGDLVDALKVFYEIPVKSTVCWNVIISGYVQNGFLVEAVDLCWNMCRVGFVMDLVTLRVVMNAASVLEMFELCQNLHGYSMKVGFDRDSFVVAELVKLLTKLAEVAYMGKLFSRVKRPNVGLYSLLISGYLLHGNRSEAVRLAEELLSLESNLKQGALVTVLNMCLCKEEGIQVHARILKAGHLSCLSACNALISMYVRFGEMMDAKLTFLRMPLRDVVSWTAIMAGFVQNLQYREALVVFRDLRRTGIELDQHSVVTTMNACTRLQSIYKGTQMHTLALKLGFELSNFTSASLLHMYAKCGHIASAARLFSYTSSLRDLILTNIMLAGYCWNSQPVKALMLFGKEYHSGLIPDQFSISTVLGACADIRSLRLGEQIHCHAVKSGFEISDVIVGNAIINMYLKSGNMASAFKLFYCMGRRNTNSYEMLMLGYIQNKGSSEALRLFHQMQHCGLQANPVMFARILRGCANLAAIDLGKQIHSSVIKLGLISDVYIDNALMGLYAESEDVDRRREIATEMSTEDNVHSGGKERILKAFGLFNLEEVKQEYHGYADIMTLCSTASYQIYRTSTPLHFIENPMISVHKRQILRNFIERAAWGISKKTDIFELYSH